MVTSGVALRLCGVDAVVDLADWRRSNSVGWRYYLIWSGLECTRLVLVQTGADWCRLVQTGADWCRLVQTGADWCSWRRLVHRL